jgi:hypothetical protein
MLYQVKKLMENMEATRQEKESLAQRCHELELRLNLLQAEIHIFFFSFIKLHSYRQCFGSESRSGATCFLASRIRSRILLSLSKYCKKNLDF